MSRINTLVLLSFAALFLYGCATSKFTQTGEIYPAYNGPIKVLTELPKDLAYVEIGWVASSGGNIHEWTDLIEAMQKKAATKGANAIVLNQIDKNRSSMITYNQQFGLLGSSSNQKNMMAIAIRILDH